MTILKTHTSFGTFWYPRLTQFVSADNSGCREDMLPIPLPRHPGLLLAPVDNALMCGRGKQQEERSMALWYSDTPFLSFSSLFGQRNVVPDMEELLKYHFKDKADPLKSHQMHCLIPQQCLPRQWTRCLGQTHWAWCHLKGGHPYYTREASNPSQKAEGCCSAVRIKPSSPRQRGDVKSGNQCTERRHLG